MPATLGSLQGRALAPHVSRLVRLVALVLIALVLVGDADAQRRRRGGGRGGGNSGGGRIPQESPLSRTRIPDFDGPKRLRAPAGVATRIDDPSPNKLRVWFGDLDTDGNGWLSLREAREGLMFDRGLFQAFDGERDGRLSQQDYKLYYTEQIAAGRTPPMPRSGLGGALPPKRTASQLVLAFDADIDKRLNRGELTILLEDYQRVDLDPRLVFEQLDSNDDDLLEAVELGRILRLIDPALSAATLNRDDPVARTVPDLFGEAVEREAPGQPPLIPGPLPTYNRLDVDADGFFDLDDVQILKGRLHLPIRAAGVLNTLDLDGDGRISEVEMRLAMGRPVADEGAERAAAGGR